MISKLIAFLALALVATASSSHHGQRAGSSFQDLCESFDPAAVGIANATVTNHAFVASGTTLNLTANDPSCAQNTQVVPVDLCRVALEVATSARSGVLVEAWLPAGWNGRLLTTGNGGLGGCQFSHHMHTHTYIGTSVWTDLC